MGMGGCIRSPTSVFIQPWIFEYSLGLNCKPSLSNSGVASLITGELTKWAAWQKRLANGVALGRRLQALATTTSRAQENSHFSKAQRMQEKRWQSSGSWGLNSHSRNFYHPLGVWLVLPARQSFTLIDSRHFFSFSLLAWSSCEVTCTSWHGASHKKVMSHGGGSVRLFSCASPIPLSHTNNHFPPIPKWKSRNAVWQQYTRSTEAYNDEIATKPKRQKTMQQKMRVILH